MNRLDTTAPPEVEYPSSDGEPMAETEIHVKAILALYGALGFYFRRRDDVYVASNIFLYYKEHNPAARRSPDVMVAFGVPKLPERTSYFTWREGVVPQVLFEFSSESTVQDDRTAKRELYEALGVREYFLFDPTGLSLDPRLQGFRRQGDELVALRLEPDGGLTSAEMGVRLIPEGLELRVIDAVSGERVLTLLEQAERADALAAEVDKLRKILAEKNGTGGAPS